MLPPDSSAARIPLGWRTKFWAISSMLFGVVLEASDCKLSRESTLFSLECSTLARARRRLSSMVLPRMNEPRIVAAAME